MALFCCIPDADTSLNYLVGMIYSNLFQTLYYVADRKYHGKLPIPVHCIMDEWPNVALPDDFDKLLATMRSRAISCSIIIQNIAQMKALFKDSWESLIGNCDEFLYLGGNEKEGHKYVSELLGKETLDIIMKLSMKEKKILYAYGCPSHHNTVTRLKWLTALTVDPEAKRRMLGLARKVETEVDESWYEDFYHHLRMEMDEYRRLKRSLRVLKSYTDYEEDLYEEAV